MGYRPTHLGHVNIYVRNAELSHKWYDDVLGLHTYHYRPGFAAFMSADLDHSHEVALMQVGDDAPLQQKGQVGLNHMAWMMASLDDLKAAYWRLKEKSVKIDRIRIMGCRWASISVIRTAMGSRCRMSCRATNGLGRRRCLPRTWLGWASFPGRGTRT